MQRTATNNRLSVLAAWIAFFGVAFGAAGPAQELNGKLGDDGLR